MKFTQLKSQNFQLSVTLMPTHCVSWVAASQKPQTLDELRGIESWGCSIVDDHMEGILQIRMGVNEKELKNTIFCGGTRTTLHENFQLTLQWLMFIFYL